MGHLKSVVLAVCYFSNYIDVDGNKLNAKVR